MKKNIVIISLIILAACVAASKFQPSALELPQMQAKVPGISYEQAQQGYSIYIMHCGNCHRVHNPAEHTQTEWDNILVKMFVKAKMKDANEKLLLQNYLHAKSK